jgi:hypothetical protein
MFYAVRCKRAAHFGVLSMFTCVPARCPGEPSQSRLSVFGVRDSLLSRGPCNMRTFFSSPPDFQPGQDTYVR